MKEDKESYKILEAREEKQAKIDFLKSSFKTVITLKSNIPGSDKRVKIAYVLINYFLKLLPRSIYSQKWYYDTCDGPYYILVSNLDSKQIKELAVDIEDNHKLGRFIDIDVFKGKNSLSRDKMRKCYICNEPAYVCIKNKTHSNRELLEYMHNEIIEYLSNETVKIVDQSIILELNLHPKFGLVTPLTSGSHEDMNYDMMVDAKDAILPFYKDMFIIGFKSNSLKSIFNDIRKIGLKSEEQMLVSTKNTNAYKGLIFNLGITVASYAYCLYNNIDLNNIFDVIKEMASDILLDFESENCDSFGYRAYKEYKILGARGEVYNGMSSVQKALVNFKDFSQTSRLRTLMYLISICEDTVLLKRAKSFEYYKHVKSYFKSNLNSSSKEIEKINNYCIRNNLSFGGSADLLVVTIFLKKILSE